MLGGIPVENFFIPSGEQGGLSADAQEGFLRWGEHGLGSPGMSGWNWFCQQFYPRIEVGIELGSCILYRECEMGH